MLALAVLVSTATFAASFSALALGFGRQAPERLEAVGVLSGLRGRAYTVARVRLVGSRPVRALCWNGPVRTPEHALADVTLVAFSDGRVYIAVGALLRRVAGPPVPYRRALTEIALAGCSRSIVSMLAGRISQSAPLKSSQVYLHGRLADLYALGARPRTRLYVDAATQLPRKLVYSRRGLAGTSSLSFSRGTPSLARLVHRQLLQVERAVWSPYR